MLELISFEGYPIHPYLAEFIFHTIILGLCDLIVVPSRSRWYTLHAIANAVIAATAWNGLISTLKDPVESFDGPCSVSPTLMILAIHIYHVAFFKLTWIDWLHHIVMCSIVAPAGLYHPSPMANFAAFFVSGVPGGIDYVLLALVKHGVIESITEKRLNTIINTWVRGPAMIICAWLTYQGLVYNKGLPKPLGVLVGLIFWWNGQYFAERVIGNYYAKEALASARSNKSKKHS